MNFYCSQPNCFDTFNYETTQPKSSNKVVLILQWQSNEKAARENLENPENEDYEEDVLVVSEFRE